MHSKYNDTMFNHIIPLINIDNYNYYVGRVNIFRNLIVKQQHKLLLWYQPITI
jgi:hypothetical protein